MSRRYSTGLLDDLRKVGKDKSLVYLPINAIINYCKRSPEEIMEIADKNSLCTFLIKEEDSRTIPSGVLYVYDDKALQEILEKNIENLEAADWPTDPEAFIEKITEVNVPQKTKLFDVVADTFADYTNLGRTDVVAR